MNPSPFSRRSFLARSLGGLSGLPALASVAADAATGRQPRRRRPAPSERITVGFIGTGRQAYYANLPGFLREPDAQVIAVCDVDSWRAEQARQKVESHYGADTRSGTHRACAVHRDWHALLAREDLDAVMISTPDHWHVPMALAAIRAGKDVACEKPLTRSIAEGRRLADAVRRSGRVFRTDTEFRSIRTMYRAVQMVRAGKIGRLLRAETATPKDPTLAAQPSQPVPPELDFDRWLGPAPDAPYTVQRVHPRMDLQGRPGWLCIRDYADGMLANWGAHLNDIALWAMNAERTGPVEIEGAGRYPPTGNLWNVILEFEVRFRFADGLQLTCRTDHPYVRFEGTEGWIQVGYPNDLRTHPESLMQWQPDPDATDFPFKTSEKRDFLDAVKSRGPTQVDAEVGHRNTSLCHLALAAIDLGRPLKWDPRRERAIGDDEARRRLAPRPPRPGWDA